MTGLRRWLALGLLLAGGCGGVLGNKRSDTYEARKRLTRELIGRQDWSAAFFYADQLHQEAPDDAEVLVLRGTIYRERGLPGEAEADLNEALAREDALPEAHAALGIMYDMTQRGSEAEPHHRKAVALAQNNPMYLNNLGFSLFLRKKHKEAIEVYQRAARMSPVTPRIRTNLGFAYAAIGDLPRAAREFEMGAPPAEAKNNLGFAYERRGDLTNAYALYIEALHLDPRCGPARANLVYVARKLGKDIPEDLSNEPGDAAERSTKPR
jgi:Flp pilus assembly protein TadD